MILSIYVRSQWQKWQKTKLQWQTVIFRSEKSLAVSSNTFILDYACTVPCILEIWPM